MKLRNKKTGEIVPASNIAVGIGNDGKWYDSLVELNEEWEDAPEEPFSTSFYTIVDGKIKHCIFYRERVAGCPDDAWAYIKDDGKESIKQLKEVGLYFETKEEAEKAVEKLKAWKRLKDIITRIDKASFDNVGTATLFIRYEEEDHKKVRKLLNLLFGGEE